MCDTCGCAQSEEEITIQRPGNTDHKKKHSQHPHDHGHDHGHDHTHEHVHHHDRVVQVEQDILSKNSLRAEKNREYFQANSILALNLVSSPGSGKTTLLERTITTLRGTIPIAVIEGDQQTQRDAERIESTGAPAVQVNTGTGCHLDADMIHRAMHELPLEKNSLLFVENVGNLVCPALFDLGEACKVVVISVTEGEDKPQKYPHMFHAAEICLINKTDLLPYVDFDIDKCKEFALHVNPGLTLFEVSARTGEGMESWNGWLKRQVNALA